MTGPKFEIVITYTIRDRTYYDTLKDAQDVLDRQLHKERKVAKRRGYDLERTDRGARWGNPDDLVEIKLREL